MDELVSSLAVFCSHALVALVCAGNQIKKDKKEKVIF